MFSAEDRSSPPGVQCECVPLLGGDSAEYGPRRALPQQGQDVSAVSASVRECIADVPAPGSDHRQHEPAAFGEQNAIDVRVAQADLVRHVGDVKLDRATAACLEVDEH